MVDASGVGGWGWRAAQRKVPFKEVIFEWLGVVVGRGIGGELGGFLENALYRGVLGVKLAAGRHREMRGAGSMAELGHLINSIHRSS